MSQQKYLTSSEAARRLRVKPKTLANWRSDPRGPGPTYRRYGNRILYAEDALAEWEVGHTFVSTLQYPEPTKPSVIKPSAAVAEMTAPLDQLRAQLEELARQEVEIQVRRAVLMAEHARQSAHDATQSPTPRPSSAHMAKRARGRPRKIRPGA